MLAMMQSFRCTDDNRSWGTRLETRADSGSVLCDITEPAAGFAYVVDKIDALAGPATKIDQRCILLVETTS